MFFIITKLDTCVLSYAKGENQRAGNNGIKKKREKKTHNAKEANKGLNLNAIKRKNRKTTKKQNTQGHCFLKRQHRFLKTDRLPMSRLDTLECVPIVGRSKYRQLNAIPSLLLRELNMSTPLL